MSAPGVNIEINAADVVRDITLGLDRASPEVEKAINRAVDKTMKWLSRQVTRDIAKNTGIAQKGLKTRIHSRFNKRNLFGYVWIGLNPLPAELAGKPVQTNKGVNVAGRFFEHAFFKRVYGTEPAVYRRKYIGPGSQNKSEEGLSGHGRPMQWHSKSSGAAYSTHSPYGRFPLERIKIDIAEQGTITAQALQRAGTERFRTVLQQELNYAINVEKK